VTQAAPLSIASRVCFIGRVAAIPGSGDGRMKPLTDLLPKEVSFKAYSESRALLTKDCLKMS